jgi:hypothetical protein
VGNYRKVLAAIGVSSALILSTFTALAGPASLCRGQALYVPVYSEVPFGNKGRTINLSATLSIRNADRGQPLTVTKVDYHNSNGRIVRAYVDRPSAIPPLATKAYVVNESDRAGGVAAFFWVEWESAEPVAPPIVEAVMISTISSMGVSFSTAARVMSEKP